MKYVFLFVAAFCITNIADAVLSPLNQSLAEFKALLDDPRLSKKLTQGETLESIKKIGNTFLIRTNQNHIKAQVIYDKTESGRVGPQLFHLEFSK